MNAMFVQILCRQAVLFPKQANQQVLSADVLTAKPIGFFRCISQHAFGSAAERKVYGAVNGLKDRVGLFNLVPEFLRRPRRTEEAPG
jgi:hypothetical protein